MSCGNAQTLFQRKHGACTARFSFLAGLLLVLCCLEAWGSGPQADGRICSPCPVNCSCTTAALKRSSCVVNCSNIGLERAPAATDIPLATTVLDLSKNHISSLDTSLLDRLTSLQELYLQWNQIKVLPRGTFCCGALSVVNLSNNQITTIVDTICDNLCNLTQIDLSSNPFNCDCKLFRLVSWLEEKGVQVRRPDAMLCHHPPKLRHQPVLNISLLTCGLNYAACLEDSSNEGVKRSELVIFSSSKPGNFTRQQCNSECFADSHRYGGLGASHECLCSTNSEPNFISEAQCSAACSNPDVMKECGWTLAHDVFAVDFSISLKPLPLPQSVHDPVALVTTSSVTAVVLTWDFGDLSPRLNTTGTTGLNTETHKYGLPGRYTVTVVARAGNKEVSARTEVTVIVPPKLELRCPSLAVANKSLSLTVVSWGAVGLDLDWKITKDGVQVAEASPHCPKDGMYHSESSSCFQIVPAELSWTDARQQCSDRGGDLAVVRSDTLSNLLGQKVTQERGVWLGLSDVNSPGKLHWVNGSEASEGEGGLPLRSPISRGNLCVSLDQNGQTSSHLCSAKRAFICQYMPQVRVPDAGIYVLGLPLFPSTTLLWYIPTPSLSPAPQTPRNGVEVLLFPALSFVQAGRLSSLEFVTQKLSSEIQVRFQTYRPYCRHPELHLLLPGCGSPTCAQVAVCVRNDSRTGDLHSCSQLEQWCPFQQRCLALSSPCHPSACTNCTQDHQLPPGAHRPRYTLQNYLVFNLPAGAAAHIVVQKVLDNLLVLRGDVIALQHDAGPAALLNCQSSSKSPWRQPMLVLNQSEWFCKNNGARDTANTLTDTEADPSLEPEFDIEKLVEDGEGTWLTDVVCPLRLLYLEQSETQLPTAQLSAGLSQSGLHSLLVTSAKPSLSASASCPLQVVSPLCLTVLHPHPQNGTFYFQANDTKLLLSVQSRYVTYASIRGSNSSVSFRSECPSGFSTRPAPGSGLGTGHKVTEPTLYAVLDLYLVVEDQKSPIQVELEAYNNVTEATLIVTVQVEVPLKGLLVQPNPTQRVLMESVVSYTALVLEGSNPSFKWIVDDKPNFTYYNTVLSVIYQHAAVYKLTVTAVNHVSSIKEHFNVTVDRLQPMANLTVSGVPDFVPQGSALTLTTSVLVDMSVDVTLRWVFGDNGYKEFKFKHPYDPALRCPSSPNQVKLSNNVTYVYSQPGIYTAVVSVSNRYDNISRSVNMSVYSMLTHVDIQTEPSLLLAGEFAEFEAHPLPSPYGIHYVWNFGDSCELKGRRVVHSYAQSGPFDVCVLVNNTISFKEVCVEMFVFEKITNLTAQSPPSTELYSPVTVWANLASGNNITWTFEMGDGAVYLPMKPQVTHIYNKEGNYTVNVTATNAVSFGWTVIPLQVFGFQVTGIEPSGCVQEQTTVNFKALVSGNDTAHSYEWCFGDGSPSETHHGNPRVSHTYHASGNYHLTLLLSSGVNSVVKVNFSHWVCVQPSLTNISLKLQKSHYAVGEEILFQVKAKPDYNYTYQWVFGGEKELALIHGSGNMVTMYKIPGAYVVSVTVFNNISSSNISVVVDVTMPIGPIFIQHNSTKHNNLSLNAPYAFTTSSLASDVSYTWNFGDGNVLIGQNHYHTYNISGKYNITLTAVNTVSRNHTFLPVTVLAPIHGLTINASLTNVPLNASVHFEAKIEEGDDVRFSWILCDRCTSIPGTNTMFYTFRSVGTFNIIVTAENDIGTTQTSIFLFVQRELEGLQILAEKESTAGSEPDTWCFATNRVLHLQAGLKEGTNMTFSWNFIRELDPDSSSFNISGKSVEVNFSTPGPCEIFLKATNLLGQLSVNKTIYFLDPAREVSLQISNNPVAVDSLTNLTVLTLGGSDLQYRWSMNGGILQWNKPWKTHSFSSPGLKQITVDVFNEVSSRVVSEIVNVQETISGLRFTATNVTEQSYVATGTNITLQGELLTGTNVTWTWLLEGRTETGRRTSLIFQEPKTAIVVLNATNDISGQVVSREFFAQEKIQGLDLKASAKIAAVGQKVEFNFSMAAGSDVHLILSISGDSTVITQPNKTYVHLFTRVDTYMVNLTAHNQVSSKRRHLQVEVMEPVRGLSIIGTCAAIPVGVKKLFVANIVTGKPVQFIWTFDLHHLHQITHMGKEMSYTPEEPGLLTIYLRAINSLQAQNITKHILVQNLLRNAILNAAPQETFIKKPVSLKVYIKPAATPVECWWKFGDGSRPLHTSNTTVDYEYSQPGYYLVQVNCSNFVSWVLAQVEVSISVLQCEEPEVQLIQAPRLAIWRSQPTMIEASVDLKGCVRYEAQYLWQILSTPYCDNVMDNQIPSGAMSQPLSSLAVPVIHLPVEVDVRRLQLSLPKMSLATGNYSLVFSLSYGGVPLRKAACLHLSVMAARLVPIIEGGTYRVWSRTQDLQLSAEQSYDPNMDPDNQSLLHYHWECESTSKGREHCSTFNFSLGSSGPVLGISGSELEAGVKYTFKLTITKDGMAPESTTQTVLVQSGHIPMVYLECVSCKAQSIYVVSQNSYVYLRGTCTNCQNIHRGRWSAMTLQNETLVLDSSSTTTGSRGMNLVLRQGVLRHNNSYIFTLRVTDDSLDGEGVASITLHHNMPPAGGKCHLRGENEMGFEYLDNTAWTMRTLLERVHFNCSGYSDLGISETPLLYSLLVTRCKDDGYCEDFCVYRGSSPEHSAFLPPGFNSSQYFVGVSIKVEDHQGAADIAMKKFIKVVLPDPPPEYSSLPHWLSHLTDNKLKKLLEQGDSQRVREISLALITVLNEYEQTRESARDSRDERNYRVRVRSNITRALTSLDLTTVSDIQQTSAALAQCTAVSREFICEECQNSTLNKLESMLEILQTDTKQGTVTPTEIADNILNIMGDLIHQVSQSASQSYLQPAFDDFPTPELSSTFATAGEVPPGILLEPSPSSPEPHPLQVAMKAYNLSSVLMLILMHARVLNEEPLMLKGAEIAATGKLADPQSLLCYDGNSSPVCKPFSIPRAFNDSLGKAAAGNSIMQLLFQVEPNPFPFNYVANYTISTEVASMEFRTENGTHIPITGLDDSLAITVVINNGSSGDAALESTGGGGLPTAGAFNISHCDSVIMRVSAGNTNRQAGLFIQLNFTHLEDEDNRVDIAEPYITAYLHSHERPNKFNCTDSKRITLSMTRGINLDHKKYTFFLSPEFYDTTLDYFVNISTPCNPDFHPASVQLEVGVFAYLCQYFSESEKQWRTDGMVPLAETNASRAVCRTRHLTAFAAGLFVPTNAVTFKEPERSDAPSLVVLLVCVLGLLSYVVAGAILHKLDQLDLRQAGVVPFCGQDGLFKYEIQVKTGLNRGAGTTAHVGISLYGRESRSGHRHLDRRGAFSRNALDIFHIATDTSLGNVWKIRVWHDNKGLSPAWMLQYILVKDLQTGSSYYFLVKEWLSVDNDKTDGQVEIEVEASEEETLLQLPHLMKYELQRALCESHLWLSLWERPPRSPFTRLQRATCCAVLLQLFLLCNTLWYSIVVDSRYSRWAVSRLSSLNGETLAAGVVTCLIAYPLYLLVFTLFRMSRSKCVSVEHSPQQLDQESVEIDDFFDNSVTGSSFLFFNGETNSEESNVDLPTPSTKSVDSWAMVEEDTEDRDWMEPLSDTSVVDMVGHGPGLPKLKRGQGSRHLGVNMTLNPDDEDGARQQGKYFTSSDEDLIKHILADGQNFFPQTSECELADLSSIFGDKTEVILLQRLNEPLPFESVRRDPPKRAFTSNTVVTDVCRPRRFPPWCGQATLWGSWAAIALGNAVSIWAGHSFSPSVAMMWLISCFASFLCSCFLLEPIKVLCEAVYYTVFVRRLRPEDQDVLVEFPHVEKVVQRVPRVRPPQGFALSQAQHQARKVNMLHTMLKNFLLYMLFLLVVLLLNYSDSAKEAHSLRLRTQLQQALQRSGYHNISRGNVLTWLNESLLPWLVDDSALLRNTGTVLLGTVRMQQISNSLDNRAGQGFLGSNHMTSSHKGTDNFSAFNTNGDNWAQLVSHGNMNYNVEMVHQFNGSLEEASYPFRQLNHPLWLNFRIHTVSVKFSLYNINTNLLAVFSFLFEFPVSEQAQSSLDLHVFTLRLITGLDLQLLLMIIMFILVLYFLVNGILAVSKEGYRYFLSPWRLVGICKLALAAALCVLHLSCCTTARQMWVSYLKHPRDDFTDFYPLARMNQLYSVMSALLLFILVLKASHQLRFLREWAVFGRALRHSIWELLGVTVALLLVILAYSHTGHLLFHTVLDGYNSVSSSCLSLLRASGPGWFSPDTRSPMTSPSSTFSSLVFHTSFSVLHLMLLCLIISVLLRNYRRARAELYCVAVDLQDYEMVELFLRRLKMWMGLSSAKEFRHKVRFEGIEMPPSRSSSTSDCKSLCLPPLDGPDSPSTPDSVDAGSEASWRPASSSPCSLTEAPGMGSSLGLGLGLGQSPGLVVGGTTWREKVETEASLKRLLPTLEALLQQLDRVTVATGDLYHLECKLERAHRKMRQWERERAGGDQERSEVGYGRKGEKNGKNKDSAGRKEIRNGKEKHRSNKEGKRNDKLNHLKDCGNTSTNLRKIATPVPSLKPRANLASSLTLSPPLSDRHSVCDRPLMSVMDKSIPESNPVSSENPPTPITTSAPSSQMSAAYPCVPTPSVPTPCPTASQDCEPPKKRETFSASSLFNHPAHTTIIPTCKRKRKPPPLKNKVHPNIDRHGPGHPKF